ncbi:hypothetical protein DFH08DRAFT_810049 [Mycena albidolilacea]|uniref:Uncharacterized protein n=1 Tax=Mycena albidolilacea TaxID=1033008 RepID=A0AAD6ZYU3_9AGAR|nr:hypothetical protein DFH08DRAFT_810049 [Mycena albidolilacea]
MFPLGTNICDWDVLASEKSSNFTAFWPVYTSFDTAEELAYMQILAGSKLRAPRLENDKTNSLETETQHTKRVGRRKASGMRRTSMEGGAIGTQCRRGKPAREGVGARSECAGAAQGARSAGNEYEGWRAVQRARVCGKRAHATSEKGSAVSGRAENKRAGCGREPRVLEAGARGMREMRAGECKNGTTEAEVREKAGGQPHTPIKCAGYAHSKQGPRSAIGCVVGTGQASGAHGVQIQWIEGRGFKFDGKRGPGTDFMAATLRYRERFETHGNAIAMKKICTHQHAQKRGEAAVVRARLQRCPDGQRRRLSAWKDKNFSGSETRLMADARAQVYCGASPSSRNDRVSSAHSAHARFARSSLVVLRGRSVVAVGALPTTLPEEVRGERRFGRACMTAGSELATVRDVWGRTGREQAIELVRSGHTPFSTVSTQQSCEIPALRRTEK